nr:PBSX family phage terminase large subunit [uncultured Intestinimonas sp.]
MLRGFSEKQKRVLTWWCDPAFQDREAILCDGAVRSGKTTCMGLGFFCWAMARFHRKQFALCGRSVGSVRRNLLSSVRPLLEELGFQVEEKRSQNLLEVAFGGRENTFYLFGGKDEASAAGIQGITLAGALLDEAALMPRSFVEQAAARCSVEGSRLWLSCNPESPGHWFYQEWVRKAEEKRVLYVHFTMRDNPALSPETILRYERQFQGSFYRRFVLGEWVAAEGLVYGFFHRGMARPAPPGEAEEWRVSCDYGTVNPASFGLWGRWGGVWYRVREFYYDSRREGRQRTDGEYVRDLERLAGGRDIRRVIVDPSAASFLEALRREGWRVVKADNDVLSGIRVTAELLRSGKIVICPACGDLLREIELYRWDERQGQDRVRKEFDHAMDEMRYFAVDLVREARGQTGAAAGFVERGRF